MADTMLTALGKAKRRVFARAKHRPGSASAYLASLYQTDILREQMMGVPKGTPFKGKYRAGSVSGLARKASTRRRKAQKASKVRNGRR